MTISHADVWSREEMDAATVLENLRFDAFYAHLFGVGHPDEWRGPVGGPSWWQFAQQFTFPRRLRDHFIAAIRAQAERPVRSIVIDLYDDPAYAEVRARLDDSFTRDHCWVLLERGKGRETRFDLIAADRSEQLPWLKVPTWAVATHGGWGFRTATAFVLDVGYTAAQVETAWQLLEPIVAVATADEHEHLDLTEALTALTAATCPVR